jgi:hypothetical protein
MVGASVFSQGPADDDSKHNMVAFTSGNEVLLKRQGVLRKRRRRRRGRRRTCG